MATWILVAQRDAAHVYRWTGPKDPLQPLHDFAYRAGRLLESTPPKGPSHEPSSHRAHVHLPTGADETHFLKELLQFLDHARAAGSFDRLFLVGEPKLLAELHTLLPASMKDELAGDVKKNLGHLSVHELREHLAHNVFLGSRADA